MRNRLTYLGNSILVLPRFEKRKIKTVCVTFKAGLNILAIDPMDTEGEVIKELTKGYKVNRLPRILSGGELVMWLLTGLQELKLRGKCVIFYDAFGSLDKIHLRIALKQLATTKEQIILMTSDAQFRKPYGINAKVIKLGLIHPLNYYK